MNDPYKKLERQLGEAVRRRAATSGAPAGGGRRRRRGWSRGVLPVIIAIAVLGTGAATAAVVLGPDDQPKNQVKQAIYAGSRVAQTSPACRDVKPGAVRLVDDPVPAGVLSQLGVLRRPAAARDRVQRPGPWRGGHEVLARSVRVARASDGWSYRLSLARGMLSPVEDPLGCAQSRRDASIAASARFDAEVRAQVAKVVDREVATVADLDAGPTFTLQFDELRPGGRPTSGGATIIHNNAIPAIGSSMGDFRSGNRRYVSLGGLVPDGVATVRVVDGSGSPRQRAVTIPVTENVYHALMSRRMGPRMIVEWRTPDDHLIRRTHAVY